MKIITDCAVHLLSEPMIYPHPEYLLPPDGTDGERIAAMGGKVCYDTYGTEGNPVVSHVKNLVKQAHFSVVEHVNVGLVISGISRGCSHEIVRHRHFSYSQRSTRYTAEDDAAIVLEPFLADIYDRNRLFEEGGLAIMPTTREMILLQDYLQAAEDAIASYGRVSQLLLDIAVRRGMEGKEQRKWARGKARQRLPHDLETRMVMTGNLRSWREFLVKRTSRHAEPEIRRLAQKIFLTIQPVAPAAFAHMTMYPDVNGYMEIVEG